MAQHDYSIANQGFPATRADINNVLSAIATNNSGTSAPSTQYAGQFWIDTTSSTWTLYIHDGADDIQFATIDTSANTVNFIDSELGDNSVTTAKIADGNVTSAKLSYPLTTFSSTGIDDNATSTAITIDSIGNVGIGKIPDASYGGYDALEIGNAGFLTSTGGSNENIFVGSNAYLNGSGSWTYMTTNEATYYRQGDGIHSWSYASSGTADTAITFSEAMRIDSSGKVGIGNTVASSFDAFANELVVGDGASSGGVTVYSGINNAGSINFADGTTGTDRYQGYLNYNHTEDAMKFYVNYSGNTSPRMTINSSGNVGIGTASPEGKLHIQGDNVGTPSTDADDLVIEKTVDTGLSILSTTTGRIFFGDASDNNVGVIMYVHTNNSMRFNTNASESMRIDSSGNVGIGNTVPGDFNVQARNLVVGGGSGDTGMTIYSGSGSGDTGNILFADGLSGSDPVRGGITYDHGTNQLKFRCNDANRLIIDSSGNVEIGNASTSGNGYNFTSSLKAYRNTTALQEQIEFYNPNGIVGTIKTDGTTTSYNTSSDYRLKENVNYDFDATSRLKQLKPARFNFIADADKTVDGFIAHEVQDIVPEAISGEKDAVNEDGSINPQGIDQSKLVPLLVKTIQELEARITELETTTP